MLETELLTVVSGQADPVPVRPLAPPSAALATTVAP
jgi:hypothetical protein